MSIQKTYNDLEDRIGKLEKEIVALRRSEENLSMHQNLSNGESENWTAQQKTTLEHIENERLEGVLEMAGAVCLELNQPLQALYFQCERLQKAISEDNILYSQIDWIVKKVDRMSDIIEKLRSIARYQTKDYVEGTRIVDIDKSSRPN